MAVGWLIVGGWGKPGPDFSTEVPGRLFALDLQTREKTLITAEPFANIDGVESDGRGGYIVTDWPAGKVFQVRANGEVRELRELVRYRFKLTSLRTSAKTQIHAVMAKEGILPSLDDMFGPGGRQLIAQMPAAKRPPALMMALHIWALSHGIASLFGRGDAQAEECHQERGPDPDDRSDQVREQVQLVGRHHSTLSGARPLSASAFPTRPCPWFLRIPEPARLARPEPDQNGEVRLSVEGPGETCYVQVCYRFPPASHPDFLPLSVLDSLLAGPSNLNLFSGGISNKTSRLYRALVRDKRLAVFAASFSGFPGEKYPNLWAVYAVPARGVTNAAMACPVCSSLRPVTAASATAWWSTMADSTSVVEIRWPETVMTSSTRT